MVSLIDLFGFGVGAGNRKIPKKKRARNRPSGMVGKQRNKKSYKKRKNAPNRKGKPSQKPYFPKNERKYSKTTVCYHGTPSAGNATSICREGFLVGTGNAYADGIYFGDWNTAKGYAGSSGVIVKCRINHGRSCNWNAGQQSKFSRWCRQRGAVADSSAKTAFLLKSGYRTLRQGKVVVLLKPQRANAAAWKAKDPNIRIVSVHRASDGKQIRI